MNLNKEGLKVINISIPIELHRKIMHRKIETGIKFEDLVINALEKEYGN